MISALKSIALRAATLSIAFVIYASGLSVSAADDAKDVNAANKEFYAALNSMFKGELDPMKKIWSHAKDVTYMGPDGTYEHGWDATLANWEKQNAKKLGGHVDLSDVVVNTGQDIAVVSGVEKGKNEKNGAVSIRATNVFRKENGTWKMIGHHTDKLDLGK